jgi:hypothetical protein
MYQNCIALLTPLYIEFNTENEALFEYIRGLGYRIVKIGGYSNMYLAEV